MPGWKGIVGTGFAPEAFDAYCHSLQWTAWRPSFIVLHNTAVPTLAHRPRGFSAKNMTDLVGYYRDEKRWRAGPHLFIDDKKIWVFTPLTVSGTHSPSWNKVSLGVEMLGDFEKESFDSGRGLEVRKTTVAALASLCAVLGFEPSTMRIHREDPLTTHRCPGKNVRKLEAIQEVQDLLLMRHPGDHAVSAGLAYNNSR